MNPDEPYFIRVGELAELAGIYPDVLQRLIFHRVVKPDDWLKAGRAFQPLFRSTNIEKLLELIKESKESRKNNVAV